MLPHRRYKIDHVIVESGRAQFGTNRHFLVGSGGSENLGSRLPCQLNRRRPDPARAAVNQHCLAGLQRRHLKQVQVRGQEYLGQSPGLLHRPACRNG